MPQHTMRVGNEEQRSHRQEQLWFYGSPVEFPEVGCLAVVTLVIAAGPEAF
jgi:hypothetical protein